MCFSAEASLAASIVLAPAGSYCMITALRKAPRLLPLAMAPMLFGIQQFAEGLVWIGLARHNEGLVRGAALTFLFFALAVWPFWFLFCRAVAETSPVRKRLMIGAAILATGWFWIVFLPLAMAPTSAWTVRVVQHSIRYEYYDLGVFAYTSPLAMRVLYLACLALPLKFESQRRNWRWLAAVAGSALVAAYLFQYAFVSVWCFFAATLSTLLVWEFRALNRTEPSATSSVHRQPMPVVP
jgi:hypothetical protein